MVFADGIIAAHDLVGLDCAETKCPNEPVFDGLSQGWRSHCTCGCDGRGDSDVGWFDAVVYAEGVEPSEIEAAHVGCVEPVVSVDRDVFAVAVSFDGHVACAAGHDTGVAWGLWGMGAC